MNYINRNHDVVLGNNDLEDLHTFYNSPVFMGCTDQHSSKDVLADMSWKISKGSGMIQLNPLLPLDVVYNAEHGNDIATINMEEHIVLEYPDCIKSEFPNFNPSKWVIVNIWREMIIQCLTKKLVDNGFTIYNIQYNIHCNNTWSFNMNIAWYI